MYRAREHLPCTRFVGAWHGTRAAIPPFRSRIWISFCAWPSRRLTFRESLRDIETCLRAQSAKLYHLGIRGGVARRTLADANERRDFRIYRDFAASLIATARTLYARESVCQSNSRTPPMRRMRAPSSCPCRCFRRRVTSVAKAGGAAPRACSICSGNIPSFLYISGGKMGDVEVLDLIRLRTGQLLHHRPRLRRLRAALCLASERQRLLRHPRRCQSSVRRIYSRIQDSGALRSATAPPRAHAGA